MSSVVTQYVVEVSCSNFLLSLKSLVKCLLRPRTCWCRDDTVLTVRLLWDSVACKERRSKKSLCRQMTSTDLALGKSCLYFDTQLNWICEITTLHNEDAKLWHSQNKTIALIDANSLAHVCSKVGSWRCAYRLGNRVTVTLNCRQVHPVRDSHCSDPRTQVRTRVPLKFRHSTNIFCC
jgi:hypothetical protein